MKIIMYTSLILILNIFWSIGSYAQILPSPQNFTTVQPKWFYHLKDIDYEPHPRFPFTEYDSYFPQIFDVHNNDVYFYGNSRVEDYYGGFLLKLNGLTGQLEWRYGSNHTNAPRPELYQEILYDESDNPILSGGQSILPYKDPLPSDFLFGITPCQYSQKLLDKSTGELIDHAFSIDTSNHSSLNLGVFSPVSYFTIHNKLYYRRIEGFRKSVFYPIKEDNLGVDFLDTAYISRYLLNYDPTQSGVPNEDRKYIGNNTFIKFQNLYFKDSMYANQALLFKEYFKEDKTIEIEMINDDLGKYLKRDFYSSAAIPMYVFNDGYLFLQNHEIRMPHNPDLPMPRTMLLWLDADGNEKVYLPELKHDIYFITSVLIPIGIINDKLYLFIKNLHNSRGRDILEIDGGGNTRIVGSIINSDPSMSFYCVRLGFTQQGDLICWTIENKFGFAPEAIGGWTTIYAFDPKDLGIPYSSSTDNPVTKPEIGISPNPVYDYIYVSVPESSLVEGLTFNIYNQHGERVLRQQMNAVDDRFEVIHLPAGLYFGEVTSKTGRIGDIQKVVIIR